MRPELRTEDIEVFSEAITHFFATCTGEAASVRSAYLLEPGEPVLWNDFNGLIEVSGDFRGSICFSAPAALLTHVLLKIGDSEYTSERQGDLVGEIANTLSGRARRHFGEGLEISPPRLLQAGDEAGPARLAGLPYAIPLSWHGYEANLVVQLEGGR